MKTAGVVCEYNPFHNGHAYHLNAARQAGATHIVAAMSGNFVQRGSGAFCDQWSRARAAVRCGADLVLELGVPFSCASAGVFARGAVELLDAFGIDFLTFGAETDELALLQSAADAAQSDDVQKEIRRLHALGTAYPAAVQEAVGSQRGKKTAEVLASPNNTLAVEYLKAAKALNAAFSFLPVKRVGAAHDAADSSGKYASAGAIREMKDPKQMRPFMPPDAFEELFSAKTLFFDPTAFETAALCALRTMTQAEMEQMIPDESGLASRIFAASRSAVCLEEIYDAEKTKSITMAKVRRAVLHCFLKIDKNRQKQSPPYLRVLAVNARGLELLHTSAPRLPLVTKHKEMLALSGEAQAYYALQCRCSDLYTALCSPRGVPGLEQTACMQIL